MRVLLVSAVLLGVVLVGAITTRASAQGQSVQAGLTSGETVTLATDANGPGLQCKVLEVRGDFLGCEATASSRGTQHWYNLRLIARIDRPAPAGH